MGFKVIPCPYLFEGEAELKYLRDNIYIGGYGIRSEKESYDWMASEFDMNIIPLELTDPYNYHLDCTISLSPGEYNCSYGSLYKARNQATRKCSRVDTYFNRTSPYRTVQ